MLQKLYRTLRMMDSLKDLNQKDVDSCFIAKTKSAINEVVDLLQTYHDIMNSHLNEYIIGNLSSKIEHISSFSRDAYVKRCKIIGDIGCCFNAGVSCMQFCCENKLKSDSLYIQKTNQNKFSSEKKQYEVSILARIVSQLAVETKCENVRYTFIEFLLSQSLFKNCL